MVCSSDHLVCLHLPWHLFNLSCFSAMLPDCLCQFSPSDVPNVVYLPAILSCQFSVCWDTSGKYLSVCGSVSASASGGYSQRESSVCVCDWEFINHCVCRCRGDTITCTHQLSSAITCIHLPCFTVTCTHLPSSTIPCTHLPSSAAALTASLSPLAGQISSSSPLTRGLLSQ